MAQFIKAGQEVEDITTGEKITSRDFGGGGQLFSSDFKPVSYLSTNNGADTVKDGKKYVDDVSNYKQPKEKVKPEVKEEVSDEVEQSGGFSFSELAEIGITDLGGFEKNKDGTFTPKDDNAFSQIGMENVRAYEEKQDSFKEVDDKINKYLEDFESYNVEDDEDYKEYAEQIKATFEKTRREMKQVNDSRSKALATSGVRSGATRYAVGSQIGIEGEELDQANERIAEINRQENLSLLEAKQAFKEDNYLDFSRIVDELKDIRSDKADELKNYNNALLDIYKNSKEQNRLIAEEEKKVGVQDGILEAIDTGLYQPLDVLEYLKLNGIRTDIKEVTQYTNLLAEEDALAGLDQDLKTFEWLKTNRPEYLTDMGIKNYQQYLRVTGDAKRAVKTSGGGSGDEAFDVGQTEKEKLIGLGLSMQDINNLEDNLNNNFSIDEILEASDYSNVTKNKIKEVFGGGVEEEFLTEDYFRNIMTEDQLKESAKEAGFTKGGFLGIGVGEKGINEYLKNLMDTINQYRQAGYTDKEILKQMQ